MRAPSALPAPVRRPLAVVAAVSAVVVVVLGVLFANSSTGTPFDVSVRSALLDVGAPWRQFSLIVDWTAEPVGGAVVFATLVVVCLRLGHRRAAVLAVAGPAVTVAVTTALKPLVGREINDGFLAYPSGHTATATAVTLIAALVFVERRKIGAGKGVLLIAVPTMVAAFVMAWAQVLLNAHYPTDTIGGFFAAFAVVPPTAWVIDRIADHHAANRSSRDSRMP
ncbi:MAG: phosphatase PAP2 family protein [Actinophytocola sp.]|uniref:phosphatase PAP2 family protein n=1 Tax=Actinophytocola sp. TaxID=1872138 RepID=UPI00132B097B|nr:phosphatase PAP2 family protein [Actinophytocola sp.]MPZ79824.1 phosphatase PAP2 family protein [Actinophytocola sp.]